ncbi:MAG: sigma 54-interacting transcriptional regulator [Desulfobulbaceae bacterium]|nr:sigma 54-interacting transcriptional regulator [Desulfobulbaceae bacterium]
MINEKEKPDFPPSASIIKINSKGHIVSVTKRAEDMIGIPAEELIGMHAADIFSRVEFTDMLSLCSQAREGKALGNHVLIRSDKKTNGNSFLMTILPLTNDDHTPSGALFYLEEPSFAQQILNSMGDGVFTVDRNWKITSFNRAAEKITGRTADRVLGRSCGDVFQSSICGRSCTIAESLYSGKNVTNRSITIVNSSGDKIPVSISAAPLADQDGNIIGGVQTFRDLRALAAMPKQLNRKYRFNEIVSKSKAMQRLFTILPDVAASPSTVMIYGESGTGKELFATALYNISDRRDKPFVVLNCGALPESLLESELFGYKAGAFTDARKDKPGRLAAADGGTLFLDEIGDIPTSVQVKLLRVLQEKVYEPLGSNTSVNIDVRIMTATNHDLKTLVTEGRFREDLYYRLNVVKIHLPPLRDRKEDIPLLIDQFVQEFSAQFGKDIVGISSPALNVLMRHDFPGNIRELKNIIEYAFILCEGGYIQQEHLPDPFNRTNGLSRTESMLPESGPERLMTLDEIERQAIYHALENNLWKKNAACRELGISKDTLRRKMQKYNLEDPLDTNL